MVRRFFIIILSLFIVSGVYVHQARAVACGADNTCMPTHGTHHAVDPLGDHCRCPLWSAELSDHCIEMNTPLQRTFQAFAPPASKVSLSWGLALSSIRQDKNPTLNRMGPAHGLHKTDSPLAFPIYLRTLALLC